MSLALSLSLPLSLCMSLSTPPAPVPDQVPAPANQLPAEGPPVPSVAPDSPAGGIAAAPPVSETPPISETPPRAQGDVAGHRRYRGIGLFTAAAVTGTAAIGLKLVGTINDPAIATDIDQSLEAECIESCLVGPVFNPIAGIVWVHSIGLLGLGLDVHARQVARRDLATGRDRSRQARILMGTGFSVIGLGITAFGLGQAMAQFAWLPSYGAYVAVVEATWWSSVALGYAGSAMAGWGTGYRRGRRGALAEVGFAPMVSRQTTGLTVHGRF